MAGVMVKCFRWGAQIRLTAEFKAHEAPCDLVDPDEITVEILPPGDDISDANYNNGAGDVVRDGLGLYHFDISGDPPGDWEYRWTGTGAAAAVAEGSFKVAASSFRPGSP